MNKKLYEKPAMQVFDLPRRQQLLTTSANGGLDPNDPFNYEDYPLTNP